MIKSAAIDHYIDSFAHVHYRDVNNRTGYNLQSYKLIDEFFECITSNIKPARNGVYTIWLRAERSTLKEFASYHVPDEEEIDDDIIQWWKDKYPNETVVYELTAIYDRETDYKAIDLNNTFVVEYDKRKECDFCYDIQDLMEWIIKETRHSVLDLMVGTYQSEFEKIIPKRLRTGTIVRKDYWDIFPDRRDKFYSDLSQDEKDEFISFASAQPDRTHKYTQRIPNMTANLFFEACSLGYAANNYDIEGLSPMRQYKKFADGRDEGLMEIDADSPLEFCKWYASEDRRGGHPWEVMRGGNSTHVQLTVRLDSKGFWFTLSGKSMVRSIETIKFYNALCRNGFPVYLHYAEEMISRLNETEIIGIVPDNVIPAYCESRFPGENVICFMNLPDDNTDEVIAKCKWQELPTTELTDEAKERAKETKGLLEAYKKADKSEQTRFY